MKKINSILWDAGGVIFPFDQTRGDRKIAEDCGKSFEEVSKILYGNSGIEYNQGVVEDYILGRINSREFYMRLREVLGMKMNFNNFVEVYTDIFGLNIKIRDFILQMNDEGVTQGVLSSTDILHWEKMNSIFNLEELLGKENIVCTFHKDAGHKKPSPELFNTAIRRLGVDKRTCVYVDDIKKYVEKALEYGFGAGVHVDNTKPDFQERCIREIQALGAF